MTDTVVGARNGAVVRFAFAHHTLPAGGTDELAQAPPPRNPRSIAP